MNISRLFASSFCSKLERFELISSAEIICLPSSVKMSPFHELAHSSLVHVAISFFFEIAIATSIVSIPILSNVSTIPKLSIPSSLISTIPATKSFNFSSLATFMSAVISFTIAILPSPKLPISALDISDENSWGTNAFVPANDFSINSNALIALSSLPSCSASLTNSVTLSICSKALSIFTASITSLVSTSLKSFLAASMLSTISLISWSIENEGFAKNKNTKVKKYKLIFLMTYL